MRPDALIFDFDGVILESVDLKTRAFATLFSDCPEHVPAIRRLHEANGGMSRYDKFRIIYRDMLGQPLDAAEMRRLDETFGDIVAREILNCPLVAGSEEFLRARASETPCYVASGTPISELRRIVEQRGLTAYFRDVLGSPRKKVDLVRDIIEETAAVPERTIMIGDALQDATAALDNGVVFIGRRVPGIDVDFPAATAAVVDDLDELTARWPEITAALAG